jgi:hypothetical protein
MYLYAVLLEDRFLDLLRWLHDLENFASDGEGRREGPAASEGVDHDHAFASRRVNSTRARTGRPVIPFSW